MASRHAARGLGRMAVLGVLGLGAAACSGGDPPNAAAGTPVEGATPSVAAAPPTALFVLGDSLSDTGNAAALADWLVDEPYFPEHTVGLCHPADVLVYARSCEDLFYRKSRVSDGPLAVEHLAAHLALALTPSWHTVPERRAAGTNYAVASARAAGTGTEDLPHQVDRLLLDHGPHLPDDALYVLMIGGNDAIAALQEAEVRGFTSLDDVRVSSTVEAIAASTARLIGSGARRLIVANVPDLAVLPAVRARAVASGDESTVLAAVATVVERLNVELDVRLDALAVEHPDAAIARFDLYSTVRSLITDAAASGRNGEAACFDSGAYRATWSAERSFHPHCAPVDGGSPRFAAFVFWDDLHPTGAAHATIGAALIGTYVASAASTQR